MTPLAVTSAKRSAALPDVPTIQESGFDLSRSTGWFGILAPPGTPPAIVQKLRDEVAKAVAPTGRRRDARRARAWSRVGTPARRVGAISAVGAGVLYQDHQGREHQAVR